MKHFFRHFIFILAAATFFSGCASATKEFSKRLRGTWQIVNYSSEAPVAYSDTRGANPSQGTITFNKNGSGSTDNASIFENLTSAASRQSYYNFRWTNTENIVTLRTDGSNVSKSWIVVTNKKNQQIWRTTDGANRVSTIELGR
jgi:hypothetical protein